MSKSPVHLFGIRHHGPGSARSLVRAFDRLRPDHVLVEGPPDAQAVLPLAADEAMRPPVALLTYATESPQDAAFYPFATYSPEWQAIQYAYGHDVPVRLIDLPRANRVTPATEHDTEAGVREDPLGALARVAGYADGEAWWEHLVESRRGEDASVFEAVAEAMAELREDPPHPAGEEEERREAYMRRQIRKAVRSGGERIAVVCGAWHVPALARARAHGQAKQDDRSLKGLPRTRTSAAWVPWTFERLWERTGYGAGVRSPAWYELLWTRDDDPGLVWLTRAARLLRAEDLDASPAHVIEAMRLATSLAALRQRSEPGLEELEEAARAVFAFGHEAPLALVRRRLVVGHKMGTVPESAPTTPLQQDLQRTQRRLRLPARAEAKEYDLDLRKPNDLARSHLLHRLRLLDVPWGAPIETRGAHGTFHERWTLLWEPAFAVALIDASRWGSTLPEAATGRTIAATREQDRLADLARLVEDTLLADLPASLEALVGAIQSRAAITGDVFQMMDAAPSLAKTCRYGDVRHTDVDLVRGVLRGMVTRICVGLGGACRALDAEAAADAARRIQEVHDAVALLDEAALIEQWLGALAPLLDAKDVPGRIAGRACRLLYDRGALDAEATGRQLAFALSAAAEPTDAAAWIEGLLEGSGALLLHDEVLWRLLDDWIGGLGPEAFVEALPMLRRTFATFTRPERRQMGIRVRRGTPGAAGADEDADFDAERAAAVLPVVAGLLGLEAGR